MSFDPNKIKYKASHFIAGKFTDDLEGTVSPYVEQALAKNPLAQVFVKEQFKKMLNEGLEVSYPDNITAKSLAGLGNYNYSQGAVVRNKKVVGIESRGGTEQMLRKCKSKKYKNNGVLIKFPKKKQDLRIDLPTVGLNTFKQCKSAGLKGIVLKNKQNIFLEKKACISFANQNKMFILVK